MDNISVIGICGQSVFLKATKLPQKGESIICNGIHTESGGKGVNTAVTIKRLGGKVTFLTAVGDDAYGKECIKFFKSERLNVNCKVKHNTATDYGVIFNDIEGNNFVSVYLGSSLKLNAKDILSFEKEIRDSKYLLLQAELSDEVLLTAKDICKKYGTKIIFDPSPVRKIPIEFLENVWLFTPNETEEKALFEQYTPNRVIITKGSKGAVLIEDGETLSFVTNPLKPNNTTGAGDVFNAGLTYSLSNGKDFAESIKFAIKAAEFKVMSKYVVDGLPRLKDLY